MPYSMEFETAFDTYTAHALLGQGGSGSVHDAKSSTGTPCAVKLLRPENASRVRLKRFQNEIQFASEQQHKNILRLTDSGFLIVKQTKCPFYVMPKLAGTLTDALSRALTTEAKLRLFSQILDGVEAAHLKGIWHRDLKPQNILWDAEQDQCVIADFGVAHFSEDFLATAVETTPQERLANFTYAAPEQRIPGRGVDRRADIYALGLILNEMFTGVVPLGVGHKQIVEVASDAAYLDDVVFAMIQHEPDKRPASIDQLKQTMNAKGSAFFAQQKLSALSREVVPASDLDHPDVKEPIRIVDVGYEPNRLIMTLNRVPNQRWLDLLRGGSYTHDGLAGSGPRNVEVSGKTIAVYATEATAQRVLDYFKGYIQSATAASVAYLHQQAREQAHRANETRKKQIKTEEERVRVLKSLKL